MPSPLGHALGGAAAGWALARPAAASRSRIWRLGVLFATLGMLPDLDLVTSVHRGPSHSLGMAAIVGLVATALSSHPRLGLAAAAAYATHTLLDWLSADTSVPLGIMALWPFDGHHYKSSRAVFDSVWRRNETPDFWPHNIRAVAKEVAILGPLTLIALLLQLRRSRSTDSHPQAEPNRRQVTTTRRHDGTT